VCRVLPVVWCGVSSGSQAPRRQKLVILGTGGTARDILDTVLDLNATGAGAGFDCVGFLDDNRAVWGSSLHGVPVLGPLRSARELSDCVFVNGIGSSGNFWRKGDIIAGTGIAIDRFATVIHPTASVSRSASIGRGVVILQHVSVTSNATIGDHVVVLPNSVVSHDDWIGDYTCVAGGVCISGNVRVGRSCYIGSRSALISGIEVGNGSLIGMGSVVLHDVEPNSVVVGNPARLLRRVTEHPSPSLAV
jgi:sugar O-acyltransferase (sialic acid O-acetyltransferase NeuD family)